MTDHPRLMIAGPVDVDQSTLAALAKPTLPHYGVRWMTIFNETIELLKILFQTKNDTLLMPGPGSNALESGIKSLIPVGSSICVPSNGFFGLRIQQIAEANGIHPVIVDFSLGDPVDPDILREQLKIAIPEAEQAGRPIRGLAVVHHETSSGILNPLKELTAVAHEFNLPFILDAVSSLGGTPLPVDEWQIDYCASVPNKCLGAPPGVALVSVSERAWELAENNPSIHGWYQNLCTWRWYIEEWGDWHPYPTTMPTNNIVSVHSRLKEVLATGLDKHIASIADAARQVREGLAVYGFELMSDPAYAAPMLSALRGPDGVNLNELQHYLSNTHQIMISGGLAEQRGKIVRIGHMGRAAEREYIHALIEGVKAFLT